MYGQDGAVVVHEARHELWHHTRIQELFESVKEHQRKITEEVSIKEVLKKKQSSLEKRKIGSFAEEAYTESFH